MLIGVFLLNFLRHRPYFVLEYAYQISFAGYYVASFLHQAN